MSSIWEKKLNLEECNRFANNSIITNLGIEYIEIGNDYITASMPVDRRTLQPLGVLHGGASAVLAETLGSMASYMVLDNTHYSVGLEIKANHIKSVRKGLVFGTVKPIHIGKTTQLWDISIKDEERRLICVSQITMVVLKLQQKHLKNSDDLRMFTI